MAEAAGSGEPADERASAPAPRRSRRRLLRVALPLALVLGAAAVWVVASGRLGSRNKDPDLLTLYGNVDIRQVELGFRVAGRIVEMRFEEGQAVQPGTPLARLDPDTYQQGVASA